MLCRTVIGHYICNQYMFRHHIIKERVSSFEQAHTRMLNRKQKCGIKLVYDLPTLLANQLSKNEKVYKQKGISNIFLNLMTLIQAR